MKILVFGGSGQVGLELQRSLCPIGILVVPGFSGVSRVDLNDAGALKKCIYETTPNIIVNAAAYTAVDLAETHQQAADLVNLNGPAAIGSVAAKIGATVIHYSTD